MASLPAMLLDENKLLKATLRKCAQYLREAGDIYEDHDFPVLARLQRELAAECAALSKVEGA